METQSNYIIKLSGIFGIIGNIICILVLGSILFYVRKTLKRNPLSSIHDQRFNWYLFFLAIADLIFSIIIIFLVFINFDYLDYSRYLSLSIGFIFESFNLYGIFLNLILSIDRYVSVTRPIEHKIKRFITQKYPKSIALLTYGIAFVITTFSFIIEYYTNPSMKLHDKLHDKTMLAITIMIIIMIIVSVSLNIASWCFLCCYHRKNNRILVNKPIDSRSSSSLPRNSLILHSRANIAKRNKPPNPYHFVLIAVNIADFPVFFLYLCDLVSSLYRPVNLRLDFGDKGKDITHTITSVSLMFGHCINVIIYLLFHKQFRAMFFKPFRMIIKKLSKDKSLTEHQTEYPCNLT